MLSAEPLIRTARRKKSILYCAYTEGTEAERLLQALALEVRANLEVCHSLPELSLSLKREKDTACLIVLEAHLAEIVSAARLAASNAPLGELVVVATEQEQSYLQQQLGAAPRIGTHWQFVTPNNPALARAFHTAYQRADQRRATRTTLDRFNARLTSPTSDIDARELRQLVISDRFLSSVLESAFDAVILVDRSGNIAAFNPSAEQLFERSQHVVLSHPVGSLASGSWQTDIAPLLGSGEDQKLVQSVIEGEEGPRHIEISATPVYDNARNVIATSLIVRDISQRINAENVLRTTEKLAAVGRLASSIAHEINNPLEAVTNLLYLARQAADQPVVQAYLDSADRELRRMSTITNQTLRFHKQSTNSKMVACEDLLESVLGVYQGRFCNSSVEVHQRFRAQKPVLCFEGEIRQVLNNLVGNAIDAMHATGGRLLLRTREATDWRTGKRGVAITVADTGPGIDRKTMERIFDPFFTTKGSAGTGLGLWISHEIVARHGGSLMVHSTQRDGASGTVFVLFLPFDATLR